MDEMATASDLNYLKTRYELIEILSEATFSIVYKVKDLRDRSL
jgi:hypothetical protein